MERSEPGHIETSASPLILSEISIRGFRCLYTVVRVLIQPDLTILTGENDGGKTTCLDAIAFLFGAYTPDGEDYAQNQVESPPIEVEGLFFGLDDAGRVSPIRIRACQPRMGSRTVEILDRVHSAITTPVDKMLVPDLRTLLKAVGIPLAGAATKTQLLAALQAWLADEPPQAFEDRWRPMTRRPRHDIRVTGGEDRWPRSDQPLTGRH